MTLQRTLVHAHLAMVRLARGRRPVSLEYWIAARGLLRAGRGNENPLQPDGRRQRTPGGGLRIPELRKLLQGDELGMWSPDGGTLELLWGLLRAERPALILECGAGVTSLLMGRYLADAGGDAWLVSLEQDARIVERLQQRLNGAGLGDRVRVLHAPVGEDGRYRLEGTGLAERIGERRADWVFVDGPAGPPGCRGSTLPDLAGFCRSGARWFLHDAFRDEELEVLRAWSGRPGLEVRGIYPLGQGLATGVVTDPSRAAERAPAEPAALGIP